MTAITAHSQTSTLGARRSRSLAAARRRSRVVQGLRVMLLTLILAVAINAGLQLIQQSLSGGRAAPAETTGSQRIVNPRFVGRDEGGAPFVVTADSAVRRQGGVNGVADLERPTLDYEMLDATDASQVLADTGVFDDAAQSLDLVGNVSLTTRSGYQFDTEAALIRLSEGEISGQVPVVGNGPWGIIRANSFQVYDDGERIVLSGDVRTRLYMNTSEETQP
ncbi:LPS export ABC transporter periplasmic protein LptC [Maricaulaceae bacterium NA33B04]|nr:LPS export ABC transporter periplasmic protein LptC [Maricaulaceae bacterium NA33B04]